MDIQDTKRPDIKTNKNTTIGIFAQFCIAVMALLLVIPAQAGELVKSGSWSTLDYAVEGQWRIEQETGGLYIVLGNDFETKNGPDLHILLSPKSVGDLNNSNTSQGALVVGLLQSNDDSAVFKKMKGPQKLKIPDGTDLSVYKSIAIHCVKYSHVWAGGTL